MTYECHVTVDYPTAPFRVQLEEIGAAQAWSTSHIDGDPLLGDKRFFYFTCHADRLAVLHHKMEVLGRSLPVPIVRKKIEKIIYDTKESLK